MGYSAALFNILLTTIQNACVGHAQGAPITKLADLQPQAVFAMSGPMAGKATPFISVRLPQEPYGTASWGGSSDIRNGIFVVDVDVVDQLRAGDHPYGDASAPGILTLSDEVMDLLEAQRPAIMAASAKLVDYELTSSAHSRTTPDGNFIAATVRVAFKTRFRAGNR